VIIAGLIVKPGGPRDGDEAETARPEHPVHLPDHLRRVRDVLEDLGAQQDIKRLVRKWEHPAIVVNGVRIPVAKFRRLRHVHSLILGRRRVEQRAEGAVAAAHIEDPAGAAGQPPAQVAIDRVRLQIRGQAEEIRQPPGQGGRRPVGAGLEGFGCGRRTHGMSRGNA